MENDYKLLDVLKQKNTKNIMLYVVSTKEPTLLVSDKVNIKDDTLLTEYKLSDDELLKVSKKVNFTPNKWFRVVDGKVQLDVKRG